MVQAEHDASVAALRELATRLYRNVETRDGRAYWRNNAPPALRSWFVDVYTPSVYTWADMHELYHVLRTLCGLVLDRTDGPGQVTTQDVTDAVAQYTWAGRCDLLHVLRWLQDDVSRLDLVDDHLATGSVLKAASLALDTFRRDMAFFLLAALNERAVKELAAWAGI
jgi:hypothetical protein